jgi:hypothetical protein
VRAMSFDGIKPQLTKLSQIPDTDPRFWWPKIEKKLQLEKKWKKLDQKLQFAYPIKDVQATEEAFTTQKRTSSTSKHDFLIFFFWSFLPSWIRIPNPYPDSGYGSTGLTESGPEHLLFVVVMIVFWQMISFVGRKFLRTAKIETDQFFLKNLNI